MGSCSGDGWAKVDMGGVFSFLKGDPKYVVLFLFPFQTYQKGNILKKDIQITVPLMPEDDSWLTCATYLYPAVFV